ncbi:MAG: hypothetical protein M1831_001527 [Alyxoria varia]|nr:MAG: hypothetical protein M1831_001527 [Alyxoria varia]
MALFKYHGLGILAILLFLSYSVADKYHMKRCFCESPESLASIDIHIYRSQRLNHVFRWSLSRSVDRALADPAWRGLRCKDPNDENSCVGVPYIGNTALMNRPAISCTKEETADGTTHEACGDVDRVALDGRVRLARNVHNRWKGIMDCTEECRLHFPEEMGMSGLCNETAGTGREAGKLVAIDASEDVFGRWHNRWYRDEERATCARHFYGDFKDL